MDIYKGITDDSEAVRAASAEFIEEIYLKEGIIKDFENAVKDTSMFTPRTLISFSIFYQRKCILVDVELPCSSPFSPKLASAVSRVPPSGNQTASHERNAYVLKGMVELLHAVASSVEDFALIMKNLAFEEDWGYQASQLQVAEPRLLSFLASSLHPNVCFQLS
jgi:hypothetical protein